MKRTILPGCLGLFILCLLAFTGCGRETASAPPVSEIPQPATTMPPQTVSVPESATAPAFSYEPGSLGSYVTADPGIEAGPEVLGGIPLQYPEGVTLVKVSDWQYDVVRKEHQAGGLLLVDLPQDLLEQAKETTADFLVLGEALRSQVMPDADPNSLHISGGGHTEDYKKWGYLGVNYEGRISHHIYRGEAYCYDLWIDWGWDWDPELMLQSMSSCSDIKPELNNIPFAWNMSAMSKEERDAFIKMAGCDCKSK